MSKSIRAGGLLVALVMLLAACTGPGASPTPPASPTGTTPVVTGSPTVEPSPTDTTPTDSPSPSPSPTPPPAVAGTLTIWADETRAPVFEQIGALFTASELGGVPVVVHQLGFGDIRDQLILRGPNGEGPDIIIGAHDWLGQLVSAGVVEPLELTNAASFDPVSLQAFTYDGTLYGMPYANEAIALYYNKDLVPEPPTTWDELKQMATDLQSDPETGVTQGFCMQEKDPYHSYPILTGFGGYIFGRDPETDAYDPSDVGLDSEGGLAYANELDQLVKDGLLRPAVDYGACLNLMTTGGAAFWMTGPWALGDFTASGINFGVAPIPAMAETPAPFVGVQGMMVSADAPNLLLAQTFLNEFMATDEAMQALFDAGQRPPAWLPTAAGVTDENVQAFITSGATGNPMPAIPEMNDVWGSWTTALDLIFTQVQEAEQAITDAAEAIRTTIGE